MVDILIRAKKERVEHKFEDRVPNDTDYCYWTGIHPKQDGEKVMFTDGVNVYAEGKVYHTDEDEGLCFSPLKRVDYPQPKKAPTRGFTYVTQDEQT